MVAFNPTDFFLNPPGLYALLSLIPLILLYLVKPKPQEKKIPSLMFFLKDIGRENSLAFFRRLNQDWLFLLQLLVLILLIMRELEDLSLGGENLLEESGQEVLEVLGKSRYYNQEFVRTGISKIPSWVKTYRLGLQKPGTLPRTMKLVKRLIVK